MNTTSDPSARIHDPRTQVPGDYKYRQALEEFIRDSGGTLTEKIENFPRYVPRQNLARFLARYEIFKQILDVQGSIVECGVFMGAGLMTFANLSAIMEPYNFQRRIIGFDTFSGFPEFASEDHLGAPEQKSSFMKPGDLAAPGGYDDLVRAISVFDMNRFLNHFTKVEVVKGDFNETSRQYLEDHPHLVISCLYLDFDVYAPTKTALELFLDRVPKGGIVVFDELNHEGFPGETIAVMEKLKFGKLRVKRFPFEPWISYVVIGES